MTGMGDMVALVDEDGALADFLADPSPSVSSAVRSLAIAGKILVGTPPSDSFTDEDYRAAEHALHRASGAQTASFVQDTLRDMFAWTPTPEFSR